MKTGYKWVRGSGAWIYLVVAVELVACSTSGQATDSARGNTLVTYIAGQDCSITSDYEFRSIDNFSAGVWGWYFYADSSPGGVPNAAEGLYAPIIGSDASVRCGDTAMMKIEAYGHDLWGAGFVDWAHNISAARADGTGYAGISFWVKSAPGTDRSFLLNVDDGRTIALRLEPGDGMTAPSVTPADQDLDGDGFVSPGDIVSGTRCTLPPSVDPGDSTCSRGDRGENAYVPSPGECGNAFHTVIDTTDKWQLVLVPWEALAQWPCPNRLDGGVDPADIAKFEIRLPPRAHHELWFDDLAFYRQHPEDADGDGSAGAATTAGATGSVGAGGTAGNAGGTGLAGSAGAEEDVGSLGSGGLAGTGGSSSVITVCPSPVVLDGTAPGIADFDGFDGAALSTWSFALGRDSSTGVYAGPFGYGDEPTGLPEAFEMVAGHDSEFALGISDTLAEVQGGGMGIWMTQCLDASTYNGISFWVRGNAPTGSAALRVLMEETTPESGTTDVGTCPGATEDECVAPALSFQVEETWMQIRAPWSDFTPGTAAGTLVVADGRNIWRLQFDVGLAWAPDADGVYGPVAAPYELAIDDLSFY